jgi:RimJ/RimL family protein N-acetyltransferase
MEKQVALKDGTEVMIRDMSAEDVQRSFDFFESLPEEDRRYLRVDVTRWEFVERRAKEIDPTRVRRLVVLDGDQIVADGSLELAGHGWGDNVAEIRLIVSQNFQRRGLGLVLARELYFIATEAKVDRIVARMMRPQLGAQKIMKRLGFHDEFLIPEHVRDQDGSWQDLIIMRCNLEDLWKEMEGVFEDSDIQWHR